MAEAKSFAEQLIATSTQVLADESDDAFCGTFASDLTNCHESLSSADEAGLAPTLLRDVHLEYERIWTGTVIVTVNASRPDGSVFGSQLELLKSGEDTLAVDPVWWIERVVAGSP